MAGITPPRTHDLVALHTLCAQHAGVNLYRIEVCPRLTPHAVDHRYPAESVLSEAELVADLENAEDLCRVIRETLGM